MAVNFNDIGVELATMLVDSTTQTYLEQYKDSDGRYQIPTAGVAVKLSADDTVGIGTSATGADTDVFFGLIRSYSGVDGYAGVQFAGYACDVPVKAAVAIGVNTLVVTNQGLVNNSAATTKAISRGTVIKAATSSDLFATILM